MEEKYRQIDFMKKRIFLDRNFRGQLIKNALCFWRRRDKIWTKLGLPWFDENLPLHNAFFNHTIKQFMRSQGPQSFKRIQSSLFQLHFTIFKLNWVYLFEGKLSLESSIQITTISFKKCQTLALGETKCTRVRSARIDNWDFQNKTNK